MVDLEPPRADEGVLKRPGRHDMKHDWPVSHVLVCLVNVDDLRTKTE